MWWLPELMPPLDMELSEPEPPDIEPSDWPDPPIDPPDWPEPPIEPPLMEPPDVEPLDWPEPPVDPDPLLPPVCAPTAVAIAAQATDMASFVKCFMMFLSSDRGPRTLAFPRLCTLTQVSDRKYIAVLNPSRSLTAINGMRAAPPDLSRGP